MCGACEILCNAVWWVVLFCVMVVCVACLLFHVFVGVVRELLCGDVWFGLCVLCLLVYVPCS